MVKVKFDIECFIEKVNKGLNNKLIWESHKEFTEKILKIKEEQKIKQKE